MVQQYQPGLPGAAASDEALAVWNTLLSMPANLFIGTRPEMINTNLDGIDIIHITTAQHVDVYMQIDASSEEEQRKSSGCIGAQMCLPGRVKGCPNVLVWLCVGSVSVCQQVCDVIGGSCLLDAACPMTCQWPGHKWWHLLVPTCLCSGQHAFAYLCRPYSSGVPCPTVLALC